MNKQLAQKFAREWIAAWNAHDLDEILSHYTDDFEMSSPVITMLTGEPSGKFRGKEAIREYWANGLKKYPDLKFDLRHVLCGANSVTLVYQGVLGLSAEVFLFGASGKVTQAFAHYDL